MPGGKVGGVADVVRDLPVALAEQGWQPTVLTPSYGILHTVAKATVRDPVDVTFRGYQWSVDVYSTNNRDTGVRNVLFDHELLVPTKPGVIYHDDGPGRPFASDANKFAFFCAAAASWIQNLPSPPDAVHLHDWHTAYYLLLRDNPAGDARLRDIPTVFTIHNLGYQGQRPLSGDESSLEAWFPGLTYDYEAVRDPVAADCINPMALAIRRADRVNTVSPTYAQEICKPSEPEHGFIGGEGLEEDIADVADDDRLYGILNGCDYSVKQGRKPGWQQLVSAARLTLAAWADKEPFANVHELALDRVEALPKRKPLTNLVSIGRLVEQKMALFLTTLPDGRTALEHILERLGNKGVFWLLGSGDTGLESRVEAIADEHANLVFMRGYSEALGELLYQFGDLFLMPSSFEPCGISQMLAMRAGQPCVVHGVGGLVDTVEHEVTGFVFDGKTPGEQADDFIDMIATALEERHEHPNRWQTMQKRAAALRFDWASAAEQYIEQLYEQN